jgi:glutamate synthase domain-containing protein 3
LVSLDAGELTTRELNRKIKDLAEKGDAEIVITNPAAKHNVAVGVRNKCSISIEGSVGYYAASQLDGPEITIDGNAGWALGENLMSGKISLSRSAGASVAASMRGGEIFIGGSSGARAGIGMKGGTLIVGGDSGFLTGFMMQKGRIIVCGDVGDAAGDSMYEGTIYVGGEVGSLGADAMFDEITEDELIGLWNELEQKGITEKPKFRKIISEKKLYHYDTLERLERTLI